MAPAAKETASEKALAAIKAIDAKAKAEKEKHLDGLKELIAEKRAAVRAIESEIDELNETMSEITGKAVKVATGGESTGRMKKEAKEGYVAALKSLGGQTLPTAKIAEKLGFHPKQWTVVRKAAEAAGVKFKKIGDLRNTEWEIKV